MSANGLPNFPAPSPHLWQHVTRLVFRCIAPAGALGLYVVLFDASGHVLAFVGPFAGLVVLQECLLRLFHYARRMGAATYEILRKDN